jgi:virulence factor Mce-like protein
MRIFRRRPGREPTAATLIKGAAGLVAMVLFLLIGLTARNGLPGAPQYSVRAEFDDLATLDNHADVRIAGKRVGQVLDLRTKDGNAVLDLELDDEVGPLPSDTTVRVRSVSLLGARYLDLSPGRSKRTLDDGATIPAARTSSSVDFPEFLRAFDEPTRTGLKTTVAEFGRGLLGRGTGLNSALRKTPALLRDLTETAQSVDAREGAARRFFPSLESAADAADPVREEIAQGFDPAARALRPFSDHRQAVQELLEEAPAALPAIRAGLAETDPLLVEATGFLEASRRMLRPAPPAFEQATALLREGRQPLRLTERALSQSAKAVPAVLELTDRVDPEISDLQTALRDSLPSLRVFDVHRCDLVGWAKNWRSLLAYGVPGGDERLGPLNLLRIESLGSGETLAGGGEALPRDPVASNAYPAPCQAGEEALP